VSEVRVVVRTRVIVYGLVQGVFYRDTCRRLAQQHGVAGWVRNRPDGTVEAVFEGASDAVDRMVAWAGQGPRGAVVERVETAAEEPEGLAGFAIR
jgi:acylphosphatase